MRRERLNTVTCVPDTRHRGPRVAGRVYGGSGARNLRAMVRDRLAPALTETLKDAAPKAIDADTGISWRTVEGLKTGRHLPDFCGAMAIALARPGSPFACEIRALLSGEALAQDPKTIDAILKGINHG